MKVVADWPIPVAAVGPVAVGATLWRLEGQTMVTVIVKMTFAFVQEREMSLVEPAEAIRTAEEHDGGHPMRSLLGARETVPQLQRVDVLLTGYAYTAGGSKQTQVRLAIDGDRGNQLDKKLLARGDTNKQGEQKSFRRMKLGYERAYGGIGYAENPLGTGYGATNKPCNIVYAIPPHDRTAGFGPIPSSFPSRKKLLGDLPRKALAERVADIPLSFDWKYFQAAPRDQQLNHLRGNEWLTLEGLHPTLRVIRTRLPSASGVARIYGAERAGVPSLVPLMPDMLHIDADNMRCSLVWRGSFPVTNEEALKQIIVAGGIETPDEPMLWPDSESDLHEFVATGDGAAALMDATTTRGGSPPADSIDHSATRVMAPDDHMAAERESEPHGAPPFAGFSRSAFTSTPFSSTRSVELEPAVVSAPFDVTPAGPPPPDSDVSIDIPGAPWAVAPAGHVPLPRAGMYSTLQRPDQDDDMARIQAQQQQAQEAERAEEAQRADADEKRRQERARAEAEQRRAAEAATFLQEQEVARQEQERRAEEKARAEKEAEKKLQSAMYGGFKRKKD